MGTNNSTGPTVTDTARALIGSVTATYRSDPVSMRQIREYVAATGGRPELVGVDAHPDEPVCAPPLFFHAACRRVVAEDDLQTDGQYPFLGVPGVSGRTMAGGSKYEVLGRVGVGDTLTVTERLQRIAEKQGTSGPLVFVTTESSYHNQAGELVARYEQTVIFR
jgi:hydroxyacyl-ACP dehydratase HTD2-like protein with hotdog domain